MKQKLVMGFDISTTTIGMCLLFYDNIKIDLKYVDFYKPSKNGNLFERLAEVRQFILSKLDKFKPDCVAIEDIVLHMPGGSSAQTIIMLAIINRLIGLVSFDKLNKPPYIYNVMRIRHALKENKDLPSKQDMPELVAKILGIDFPYIKNKKNEPIKENEDMADAVACAICHIYADREGKAEKLQIKKKKKRRKKKK